MIESKDITFVLQGKNIHGQTRKCINSIRKYYRDSTIIFSTYKNEKADDLDVDTVVFSKDPGATLLSKEANRYNNINRIIITSKAGLEKVKTKYCAKLRSDLIFKNNKILNNIFDNYSKRDKKFSVFKQRVVFFPLWSRRFEYIADKYKILCPFLISDWFCFGLTEDIKNYFKNCPLTTEPEYSNYYKIKSHRIQGFHDKNVNWQFPPEQWICTHFFSQYFKDAKMICSQDYSLKKMEMSDKILTNNIIIAGYKELGVFIQKTDYKEISKNTHKLNHNNADKWLSGVFSQYEFMKLYKKYCDPRFVFPLRYRFTQDLHIEERLRHLAKHWYAFKQPLRNFLKWAEQLLSCGSYALQTLACCVFYFPGFVYQQLREGIKRK